MSKIEKPEVEVDVERLDMDIIDDHLRNSTVVLHDILKDSDVGCDPTESGIGFTCIHCNKIYKTKNTLQAHNRLIHPQNEEQGQCETCDKQYPSLLSLQKHIRYMHRYIHRCKVCYKTFETAELLEIHGEGCSKCDSPCLECGKVFDSQVALRNHIKYKHPKKFNHWCETCRRTFTTYRRLMNHNASIHPTGATECVSCDKTFNSIAGLQTHILYKHSDNGSKCFKCHKIFAKRKSLIKHLSRNHNIEIEDSIENSGIYNLED